MDPLSCMLSFGLACAPPAVTPSPEEATTAPADPAGSGTVDSADASASRVLERVQSFYDSTQDLTAKFRQTYLHPVYGTKTVSGGDLLLKRPGMMVWDYKKATDPDFYADGDLLWVIERDTRQVVKKDVRGSDFAGAVRFLFGGRTLIEDFWVRFAGDALVERYGMPGHDVIELRPKKNNAHYKRLLLVVAPGGRVDAFVIRNGDDSTNHFVLEDISTNNGLARSRFTFKAPKGYAVIEE